MQTLSPEVLRGAIFILAVLGYWVARHIHTHKKPESAPLVCPLKMDCHGVVHSDYSRFMGVNLEIWGMVYYGLISLLYLLSMLVPLSVLVLAFGVGLSAVAFLFSLYLIGVQIFALKKGCFWCFVSAFISTLIFVLTILMIS